MHSRNPCLVALEAAPFKTIILWIDFIKVVWLLYNKPITTDGVSHVSIVNVVAPALVSWQLEANMPRTSSNVIGHDVVRAVSQLDGSDRLGPFHVKQRPRVLRLDTVDNIVIDNDIL